MTPSLKPFLNQCCDQNAKLKEETEEWSVFLRIQAERFFEGTGSIYREEPISSQTNLEIQMKIESEDLEEMETQWSVQMLPPRSLKQRPRLEFYKELKNYLSDIHEDSLLIVEPRIDIFARCAVNGSTFLSAYNRTDRGRTALVYCVDSLDHNESENEVSPELLAFRYETHSLY